MPHARDRNFSGGSTIIDERGKPKQGSPPGGRDSRLVPVKKHGSSGSDELLS